MGLSPRQQRLQELWAIYCGYRWDNCSYDWDGTAHAEGLDLTAAQAAGRAGGGLGAVADDLPMKYRRPSAPVHLGMVIVNRFTNLLFGHAMRPRFACAGDPDTEDWIAGALEAAGYWVTAGLMRQYGGGTGTGPVGFSFKDGKLRFETCNPCWLRPTWRDREEHELEALEKRMPFPDEVLNTSTKMWETKWFWYRRVITTTTDTVFEPVLIPEDGEEPVWTFKPENQVEHGFGFVPWEWIQNLPDQEDDDGEHDFAGTEDLEAEIARLSSQAHKAIICNLDPTALIKQLPGNDFDKLRKGSSHPIRMEVTKDGTETAEYLEASLPALASVLAFINFDRASALEIAQCVIDTPDGNEKTATEARQRMGPMLAKCDMLREQYGRGMVRLIEKIVKAARKHLPERVGADGVAERGAIYVPPREEVSDDGKTVTLVPRKLGPGGNVKCVWPKYSEPGSVEQKQAVDVVIAVRVAGLLDLRRAVELLAAILKVDDPQDVYDKLTLEQQARLDGYASEVTRGMDPVDGDDVDPDAESEAPASDAKPDPSAEGGTGQEIKTTEASVLNGAQVSAAVDIVAKVVLGELPRDSGIAMLEMFFNLTTEAAKKVMGSAGTPKPTTPNPTPEGAPDKSSPPFGGGGFGGNKAPPFGRKPKPDDEEPEPEPEADATRAAGEDA